MTDEEKELDRLYEELTINKELIPPQGPPCGGYGGSWHRWSYWNWGKRTEFLDIKYTNADGKLHRLYGPAYISRNYDVELWYKNGVFHREDGPAIRHKDKTFLYYYEGKLHRLDGPAIVERAGPKQFWIMGQKLSPKEYKKEIERRKRRGLL